MTGKLFLLFYLLKVLFLIEFISMNKVCFTCAIKSTCSKTVSALARVIIKGVCAKCIEITSMISIFTLIVIYKLKINST